MYDPFISPDNSELSIAVIGLGYVGLPLALAFSKKFSVVGFDIDGKRVCSLHQGIDDTHQACKEEILESRIFFTSEPERLGSCNVYVVTVPTPIDEFKRPDLRPLHTVSSLLGQYLKKGDIVIYESTVYPGCTEEECVPLLEKASGLAFNTDFFCGYSPERVSPGDTINTLTSIIKVTSGSTPGVADFVDALYSQIITAGTCKVSSIKVAEAAKAIENAQRDVNISFVNELALIFDRIGIDTSEVIDAAATKWNFLKFKPGLVGGHCIGVDPYYLAYKAESLGYYPQVILSGRRVNDFMASFVVNRVIKLMISKGSVIRDSRVLILGITFKENCPDIRNTKVIDIYKELQEFGCKPEIYDPVANPSEVHDTHSICLLPRLAEGCYDAIILAVAHKDFLDIDFCKLKGNAVLFDTKAVIRRDLVDGRL